MNKTEMREVNVILDTNIIMNLPDCFYTFIPEEDDKQVNVILNSVVIVELDNNKSGFSAKAVNSRLGSKAIDSILNMGGVIGKNCNLIIVHDSYGIDEKSYMGHDKIIIQTALDIKLNKCKDTKLITNDRNVLILAKSRGLCAEIFKNDCADTASIYEEVKRMNYSQLSDEQIQKLNEGKLKPEDLTLEMIPNEALIFDEKDVFIYKKSLLKREKYPKVATGIKPKNIEQQIFMAQIQDENVRIAVSTSKAGSGKSIIALACALEMVEQGLYDKVVILKPTIAMDGEEIGWLPGGLDDKVLVHFENVFDSLEVIYNLKQNTFIKDGVKIKNDGFSIFEQLRELGKLDVKTLTFLRGTSKDRTIFICEEFQNLPLNAVKSTLTRLSDSSKAILCSDIMQIDNKYLNENNNGVTLLVDRLRGQEFFSFVNLKTSVRGKVCDIISDLL